MGEEIHPCQNRLKLQLGMISLRSLFCALGGSEDDWLGHSDIWMEMNPSLECSKDASIAKEYTAEEEEEDE
ncbi:hypothetical protein C5167_015108 [Papaver somniferum]|uniref:Uncharacterized protein n=1 Tax=Papaver somniferum TaxID=3469 RepID=A0A4Y7J863_PAPSO|nr:hypothetical protein C5167_015108 [Papaver somniferum]